MFCYLCEVCCVLVVFAKKKKLKIHARVIMQNRVTLLRVKERTSLVRWDKGGFRKRVAQSEKKMRRDYKSIATHNTSYGLWNAKRNSSLDHISDKIGQLITTCENYIYSYIATIFFSSRSSTGNSHNNHLTIVVWILFSLFTIREIVT